MAPVLYGIPNCDTVRRARAWLAAQGVQAGFHDFRKAGLPDDALGRWIAAVGWERLLNRQGTTWRRLDDAARAAVVDAASAAALMRAQPSLVKRPVVDWPGGAVTVGFDPARWRAELAAAGRAPPSPDAP
jgi:Spx/MgsR family transcriptional regulator